LLPVPSKRGRPPIDQRLVIDALLQTLSGGATIAEVHDESRHLLEQRGVVFFMAIPRERPPTSRFSEAGTNSPMPSEKSLTYTDIIVKTFKSSKLHSAK